MATNEIELNAILQTATPTEVNTDCLGQIATTQQKLSDVKINLGNIVESMAHNQSIISRAAKQWGELPVWQKVAGGVTLTVATLPAGFVSLGALLALGGVTLTAYTTTGYILEDHHLCNKHITEQLKKGILNLADVLELTIRSLEQIKEKFNEEINKFRVQNVKLADNVFKLTEDLEKLNPQLELLTETTKLLREKKEELETTNQKLLNSSEQQSQLFAATQKELEATKALYDKSQIQLSEKVVEVGKVREKLSLEVEQAKKVAATLQGTVQALAGTVIADAAHRDEFKDRLNTILGNKEERFNQAADRISATEQELAKVKAELQDEKNRYKELLDRQDTQIQRLEKLNDLLQQEQQKPNAKLGGLLEAKGFYSLKENKPKKPLTESNAQAPGPATKVH